MNRFIVCLLLSAIAACASATAYTDCGSTSGQVIKVTVVGCPDGQDTCILKKGTQPTITIKFSSSTDTTKVKAFVHGVINHVPLPFPLPQPDACKSGVSCPVKSGQSYTYSDKVNVKKSYPAITVTVRYELKSDSGDDMVCVDIPSQIL